LKPLSGGEKGVSIGQRIAELRQDKGVSLQDVADAVGVSKAHIWQLERGEKGRAQNPAMGLVERLADYFGVSVAFLVGEDVTAEATDPELAGLFRQAKGFDERERQLLFNFVKSIIETRPGHRNYQRLMAEALMKKR
jgi:transcriptional regulator with XRE-family HTH domain